MTDTISPRWAKTTLKLASGCNMLWGAVTILFPYLVFDLTGAQRPFYPQIWQCVGMIVCVSGIAYAVASVAPLRHWPVVLAGLMGKVFGPAGFALAVYDGVFPVNWGWMIVLNDLVWWVPFYLILQQVYRVHVAEPEASILPLADALEQARTQDGVSVAELSDQTPVLLVFLRHFGCTFCREALADVSARRNEFKANDARLVLVHMVSDAEAARTLGDYG